MSPNTIKPASQTKSESPGSRFRRACEEEKPLQVVGVINAYAAKLAARAGFRALYLSGAGVANASYGLPDLGYTSRANVLEDVKRIAAATTLPLLVDVDTGWNDPAKTVREMIKAGAAAIHIEDQVDLKRCGHRPGKRLVPADEMVKRVKAAVAGRSDRTFVIMARTDAAAVEGFDAAILRANRYVKAGADMIFAEALTTLDEYRKFATAVRVPVLANITEFGKTPLFTVDELGQAGARVVLYPLSAFRAMSAAAIKVYGAVRRDGTQKSVTGLMQTREELYDVLDYHRYEEAADKKLKR